MRFYYSVYDYPNFFFDTEKIILESGIRRKLFVFCRVHPSVLFVSSLWNCHISSRKDNKRKEMGPEGPKDTRPDVLFTWALRGQWKAKAVNWLQTFL